jgi:hypothetical protein
MSIKKSHDKLGAGSAISDLDDPGFPRSSPCDHWTKTFRRRDWRSGTYHSFRRLFYLRPSAPLNSHRTVGQVQSAMPPSRSAFSQNAQRRFARGSIDPRLAYKALPRSQGARQNGQRRAYRHGAQASAQLLNRDAATKIRLAPQRREPPQRAPLQTAGSRCEV